MLEVISLEETQKILWLFCPVTVTVLPDMRKAQALVVLSEIKKKGF